MDEASARMPAPETGLNLSLLGFGLAALRVWQWTSSLSAFTSLALLYHHSKGSHLSQTTDLRTVQLLSLVTLVYATLVICGVHIAKTLRLQRIWRACAVLSVPGDLAMVGICLADITLLAYTGLPADCHGFTPANNEGNDLLHQPATGFETSRIGWAWSAALTAELDRVCAFPRTVYGLSVLAIFSYTFSILLSVLYLQQQQQQYYFKAGANGDRGTEDPEKASQSRRHCYPINFISFPWRFHATTFTQHAPSSNINDDPLLDAAEQVRPPFFSPSPGQQQEQQGPPIRSLRSRDNHSPTTPIPSRTLSVASHNSSNRWGTLTTTTTTTTTTLLASDSDSISLAGPLNLRPPPAFWPEETATGAGAAPVRPLQRRWSTSTSSSYNANAFLVTDGFRPEAVLHTHTPPAYSSPPGSLYHETMKYDASLGTPGLPQQ